METSLAAKLDLSLGRWTVEWKDSALVGSKERMTDAFLAAPKDYR